MVWRERRNRADPNADSQRADDPFEIWAERIGSKPRLIHRGYMPDTYPYLAADNLLFMDRESRYVLERLSHPGGTRRFPQYFDRYDPFGSGHLIAFVTESESTGMDSAHVIDLDSVWN